MSMTAFVIGFLAGLLLIKLRHKFAAMLIPIISVQVISYGLIDKDDEVDKNGGGIE